MERLSKKAIRRGWMMIGAVLLGIAGFGIGKHYIVGSKAAAKNCGAANCKLNPVSSGLLGEQYKFSPSAEVQRAIDEKKQHPEVENDPTMQGLSLAPILGADRLVFRAINSKDLDALAECFEDRETVYMLVYMPWPFPKKRVENYMRGLSYDMETGGALYWAITDPKEDRLMGVIGATLTHAHDRAEIHYWLTRKYWGNGYMTEAVKRLSDYLFRDLNMNRLDVNFISKNERSQRVVEKCGFKFEYEKEAYVKKEGKYEDLRYYRLMRYEYMK